MKLLSSSRRWIAGHQRTTVFVAALVLRLGWVIFVADFTPVSDSVVYLRLGATIAQTGRYENTMDFEGHTTFAYRPPGYPFFLSLFYRVTADPLLPIQVTQCLLSTLLCVMMYGLLKRLTDRENIALCGALLYSVYPASIGMCAVVWSESVSAFLTFAAFYYGTTKGSWWRTVFSGLFLAAACFFRPNTVLLLPFVYLPLLLNRDRTAYALRTAVLVAVLVAATVPWTVRNCLRIGEVVWMSSNFGPNFYYGHNPESTGIPHNTERMGEVLDGMDADEVEKSRILLHEALRYAREHPAVEAGRFIKRLGLLLFKDRAPVYLSFVKEETMAFSTPQRFLGWLNNVFYLVILGAAVWVVADRRCHRYGFAYGFMLAFLVQILFYAATVADERYKVPIVPFVFAVTPLSVCSISRLAERWAPKIPLMKVVNHA